MLSLFTFTSLSKRWAALCTLASESAESLHNASKIWLKNTIKSPLTTCKMRLERLKLNIHRRHHIWTKSLRITPLLCYIELHKHNNELCYLDQKRSLALVVQFAAKLNPKISKGTNKRLLTYNYNCSSNVNLEYLQITRYIDQEKRNRKGYNSSHILK